MVALLAVCRSLLFGSGWRNTAAAILVLLYGKKIVGNGEATIRAGTAGCGTSTLYGIGCCCVVCCWVGSDWRDAAATLW